MKKNFIIGLCVLIALGVLFFGMEYLKGVNVFKPSNYYQVSYTNVAGLQISAPVSINGFKVGQVKSIEYEYDNPGHVLVELSLDKALRIPQGTKAIIECDMLGTATVKLEMGTSDTFHNVGDKIIGVTSSSMMDNISQDLLPAVNNVFPKIDTLLTSINTIVADPALINAVKRLDQITANLEATMAKLNKSVNSLPQVMDNVKDITSNASEISQNLNTVTGLLAEMPLDSAINNVCATTANLRQLTNDMKKADSSLGLLLNDRQLYDNLNRATRDLDSLFVDIKKNPKRYISIKLL